MRGRDSFDAAPTLMVQGCTSDAGKSVLVAGLCRLLTQQQVSVAPLKPQNMALNSAVTVDGGEIGRAQAVQAAAANVQPHTDMNPVLLKPSSDIGAQVIVHGKVVASMQAAEFHAYKKTAMAAVLESHTRLSSQYQQIMVEGAGSPAEVNLREGDIANMGFAEAVDCPVIIVADIDRGGVFAHLVGTLDVLSKSEQDRIVGFVINRFRGDIALLEPGIEWLEKKTNKPVLGVLPFLQDFYLDAEDAISTAQPKSDAEKLLKVVVPVLPRISNHTDFDALRLHPNVDLKFVSASQACPSCDLIILPGSKNVLSDLQTLKDAAWAESLNKHLRYGGKVIGICGGWQMLGQSLTDPEGLESLQVSSKGFGLFDMVTELHPEKQLKQVFGQLNFGKLKGTPIKGYEIHCGVSTPLNDSYQSFIVLGDEQKPDGMVSNDGQLIGTYLHGLFDNPQSCDALLGWAGLPPTGSAAVNLDEVREQQLDRLATALRENLSSDFLNWLASSSKPQRLSA